MSQKKLKVEFAPGAFDHFEGTQEELDQLVKEIQEMFAGKSKEELAKMSRPLTEEDLVDLPVEVKSQLASELLGEDSAVERKLQ